MLRLIGILTGSALAVAILIVALGLPRFTPPEPAAVATDAVTATTHEVIESPNDIEPVAPAPLEPVPVAPVEEPVADPPAASLSDAETEALIEEIFAPQPQPVAASAPPLETPVADENWYAFWSPFRSEIAANGFIARLQETTGIDYRVVKVKTGVYEVAFAYDDDADIQDKLARISDATGLDMTGG